MVADQKILIIITKNTLIISCNTSENHIWGHKFKVKLTFKGRLYNIKRSLNGHKKMLALYQRPTLCLIEFVNINWIVLDYPFKYKLLKKTYFDHFPPFPLKLIIRFVVYFFTSIIFKLIETYSCA